MARRGKPGPRGEGFQETKALPWAVGVGGRLGGSLWRHVHPAGVGLCGLGFGTVICPCLCVSGLCAGVRRWVSWARRRVSLYVVRAVYVSGLGVRGVCARPEPAPPQLLAPCCRPGPRLGSNFSPGSPRGRPPLFSLLRSSGQRASGMGRGGGIGRSWAPARAGRSVPDLTGSRRDAAGPGLGPELERGGDRAASVARPASRREYVTERNGAARRGERLPSAVRAATTCTPTRVGRREDNCWSGSGLAGPRAGPRGLRTSHTLASSGTGRVALLAAGRDARPGRVAATLPPGVGGTG